jgi:Na+/H+ antiporter NhaD/arsenite permease-like protein
MLNLLILPFISHSANKIPPSIFDIRIEFIAFALILAGIAVFHKKTFQVAVSGLIIILLIKLFLDPSFDFRQHFLGSNDFLSQVLHKEMRQGEWPILLNLLGLLLGFAILSKHFEESGIPGYLPKWLPDDWKGPFFLLIFVFILSSFLDNIAAAMIGGTIALVVFKRKVHIGFIAAIVAASNAGGSGSVIGDTTTTMMWIDGVSPLNVLHAYIASGTALLFFAWFASHQQDKYQRIEKNPKAGAVMHYERLVIVFLILIGAVISNFLYEIPALGVWVAILAGSLFCKTPWKVIGHSFKGTFFLLCLVTCASLMPVEVLPEASWISTFILGCVSAVFDNIPLTKLCLDQGCYDWGMLAYAIGFGGSMIWFGSSAGVAITNEFPEARNIHLWIRKGWHIILAYIIGFIVLYTIMGWEPADNKNISVKDCTCSPF